MGSFQWIASMVADSNSAKLDFYFEDSLERKQLQTIRMQEQLCYIEVQREQRERFCNFFYYMPAALADHCSVIEGGEQRRNSKP